MRLPFLSLLRGGCRLLIFATGLLLGIQAPAFVDQYQARVDAHYREVSINISGFQRTADTLFEGDLDALVAYYRNSSDRVFSRDADSVAIIVSRYQRLAAEQASLSGGPWARFFHVLISPDPEFFEETFSEYGYTVPLNTLAITWGVGIAIVFILVLDLLIVSCRSCGGWIIRRRRQKQQESWQSGE